MPAVTCTGDGKYASCQPELVSPVKVTVARSFPFADHRLPTCVPVFFAVLKKRKPVTYPEMSGTNCIPISVAAGSFESGFNGRAVSGHMVQGHTVTVKGAALEFPFNDAVTFTVDWPLGLPSATAAWKVLVDEPAGTATDAGTVTAALSLARLTVTPPVAAGLASVIVQLLLDPAFRLAESHVSALRAGDAGDRLKVAVAELVGVVPASVAVIVTLVAFVTVPAVAVKFDEVAPVATVTDLGRLSPEPLRASCTVRKLTTARLILTVHVLELPEFSDVGLQVSDVSSAFVATVTEAVFEEPFNAAVIVTVTLVLCELAVAVNEVVVKPAVTVTLAGTVTRELVSDNVTLLPPEGAV